MMIKKIILFFLLIAVSNCGYEPTLKKNFNLSIQNFELIGDKNIGRRIVSLLGLKKNLSNTSDYTMTLNSQKSIVSAAKDKSGKTSVFRTIINLKLQLNQNGKLIKKRNFSSSFTYNNLENNHDLLQYQKTIEINLINKIFEEIIIFLST